jgi:hypothetical protein
VNLLSTFINFPVVKCRMKLQEASLLYEMTHHKFISLPLKTADFVLKNSLYLTRANLFNTPMSSRNFSEHTVLLYKLNVRNNNKSLIRRDRRSNQVQPTSFTILYSCKQFNSKKNVCGGQSLAPLVRDY